MSCLRCISRGNQSGSGLSPRSVPSPWASQHRIAPSALIRRVMDHIASRTGTASCRPGLFRLRWEDFFYFRDRSLSCRINANRWALIVLLMAAHAVMLLGDVVSRTVAPYLGTGAMFVLLSIWDGKPGNNMQDFFGRASYHLFIGHMPIAAVLVTGLKLTQESLVVFLSAAVISLALSAELVPIERYINITRLRIADFRKKLVARTSFEPNLG